MDWRHAREILDAADASMISSNNGHSGTRAGRPGGLLPQPARADFLFKAGKGTHINNFGLGESGRYRTNLVPIPRQHLSQRARPRFGRPFDGQKPTAWSADSCSTVRTRRSHRRSVSGIRHQPDRRASHTGSGRNRLRSALCDTRSGGLPMAAVSNAPGERWALVRRSGRGAPRLRWSNERGDPATAIRSAMAARPSIRRWTGKPSGNPRGRKKGTRGLKTDLHAELISRMTIPD